MGEVITRNFALWMAINLLTKHVRYWPFDMYLPSFQPIRSNEPFERCPHVKAEELAHAFII